MNIVKAAFLDELAKLASGEIKHWPAEAKADFARLSRNTPAPQRKQMLRNNMNLAAYDYNYPVFHRGEATGFSPGTTSRREYRRVRDLNKHIDIGPSTGKTQLAGTAAKGAPPIGMRRRLGVAWDKTKAFASQYKAPLSGAAGLAAGIGLGRLSKRDKDEE